MLFLACFCKSQRVQRLKPGLHTVRRSMQTEMRKPTNADTRVMAFILHAYISARIRRHLCNSGLRTISGRWIYFICRGKLGVYFESKSTPYTQTIVRTWGAYSRQPMSIYAVGNAQVPSINTPTIRWVVRVDAGLALANSPRPLRIPRHMK